VEKFSAVINHRAAPARRQSPRPWQDNRRHALGVDQVRLEVVSTGYPKPHSPVRPEAANPLRSITRQNVRTWPEYKTDLRPVGNPAVDHPTAALDGSAIKAATWSSPSCLDFRPQFAARPTGQTSSGSISPPSPNQYGWGICTIPGIGRSPCSWHHRHAAQAGAGDGGP